MKLKIPILFICLLAYVRSNANVHLFSTYTNVVFVDGANVREAPSLSSKVIGKLSHNTEIKECPYERPFNDSIGGVASYWTPIAYNNTRGYIWNPVLADGYFISQVDIDNVIMINFSSKRELEFKIFNNGNLICHSIFKQKKLRQISGSTTFGKTFNSNGNEVIAIVYENDGYELYEWDGTTVKEFKIKLNDDSFITGEYKKYPYGIINANSVNIRTAPNKSAKVIESLPLFTQVPFKEINVKKDTIDGQVRYWHRITWKGKEAFVWSKYIDIPIRYIKSNKKENEAFLYTNAAIYALEGEKILDRCGFWESGEEHSVIYDNDDDDFFSFGNQGLQESWQFLAICITANTCGASGGDKLYVWDGQKIKYFGYSFGIGDGGMSEGHYFLFPADFSGIKNKIVLHEFESEMADIDIAKNCKSDNEGIMFESYTILEYNGDTLIEVPSQHSKLRKFISDNFPKYQLRHYKFYDFNNDGIEDAIFFMHFSDYENKHLKPIIGIAFGDKQDSFSGLQTNKNIVQEEYFSVMFNMNNSDLEVTITYNLGYNSNESNLSEYAKFVFRYDQSLNSFHWYSKTEAVDTNDDRNRYDVIWGNIKTRYFKSKKILFENTWGNSIITADGEDW